MPSPFAGDPGIPEPLALLAVALAALAQLRASLAAAESAAACLEVAVQAGTDGDAWKEAESWWRRRQREALAAGRFVSNDLVHLTGPTLQVNSVRIALRSQREIALIRTLVGAARQPGGRFLSVAELAIALRATAEPAAAVQRAVSDFRIKLQAVGLSWNLIETEEGERGTGYRLSAPAANVVMEGER